MILIWRRNYGSWVGTWRGPFVWVVGGRSARHYRGVLDEIGAAQPADLEASGEALEGVEGGESRGSESVERTGGRWTRWFRRYGRSENRGVRPGRDGQGRKQGQKQPLQYGAAFGMETHLVDALDRGLG